VLDEDHEEMLIRLLDIFVIHLEGGTQADIEGFFNQSDVANAGASDAPDVQQHKSPRTSSIFFKALPPSVTRAELSSICARYPGFIRVAIAEPAVTDRRMARRGWATFQRGAKVREICFSLNGMRLRGWELNPVLNEGAARVSLHDRRVVRSDLALACRLIAGLDKRRGLWQEEEGGEGENPLLKSVQDHLVEEVLYL
jgi:hypothetical protein